MLKLYCNFLLPTQQNDIKLIIKCVFNSVIGYYKLIFFKFSKLSIWLKNIN